MKCDRSRQSSISFFLSNVLHSFCVLCFFVTVSSTSFCTKAFLSPNFYFRFLSADGEGEKQQKKRSEIYFAIESKVPMWLIKSKCACATFQTIQIISRMNAIKKNYEFDPFWTGDVMTGELRICHSPSQWKRMNGWGREGERELI